jgi:hypothetical protein
MSAFTFFPVFFTWWYTKGIKDLLNFIGVYFSYLYNLFSVTAVLKTFFSPWKRMVEARQPGIDGFRDWLIDNLVSRGVAIVMRTALLVLFILTMVFFALASVFVLVFWIFMPLAVILLFLNIWR